MKVVAFIPARYDSKRFPGKPLALIAAKPMIQHVYERAQSCPEISEIFVATDDERIFKSVLGFGGKAIMTEKEHPSGTDRIAEATQELNLPNDNLIVNIQGDQPIFQPSAISDLTMPFMEGQNIPMSTLKYKIRGEKEVKNPNYVKVVTDAKGFALYFSRSPVPFFRDSRSSKTHYKHLGFYAYSMAFLKQFANLPVGRLESSEKLEQLRALENDFKIRVMETAFDSVEVDAPEDLQKVEKLLQS